MFLKIARRPIQGDTRPYRQRPLFNASSNKQWGVLIVARQPMEIVADGDHSGAGIVP
jgi:hypothetical protein